MTLNALILTVLLVLGGDAALANLEDADWEPGKLRLPLTVVERSGVTRHGVAVTGGVPFPPGFLPEMKRLCVTDAAGKPVASQATVMTRWWRPRYDDSVRWALISFRANVEADGTATYYLTDNAGSWPATRLAVKRNSQQISVSTGEADFTIPLAGTSLLSGAAVDGRNLLEPAGLRGVITSGKWQQQGLSGGRRHAPVAHRKWPVPRRLLLRPEDLGRRPQRQRAVQRGTGRRTVGTSFTTKASTPLPTSE